MDCIFCAIVSGQAPAHIVAQSDHAVAFMDINPATHGHCLVIPRVHADDLLDISAADLSHCSELAQTIAQRAMSELGADGVNLVSACRPAAWQTVFHFHIHVVPRYAGVDGLAMPWIPTPGDPSRIARAAEALRSS